MGATADGVPSHPSSTENRMGALKMSRLKTIPAENRLEIEKKNY